MSTKTITFVLIRSSGTLLFSTHFLMVSTAVSTVKIARRYYDGVTF